MSQEDTVYYTVSAKVVVVGETRVLIKAILVSGNSSGWEETDLRCIYVGF